jgi:BCD family chlorophyll transporter-like MFS transporter
MKTVIKIVNYIRLGAFPLAYGLVGALIGGTLNRIMIAELGFAATWVGIFFAVPLLVSPLRVWLGYRSDGFPIFGKRREPYMLLGAIIIGVGVIFAVRLALSSTPASVTGIIGVLISFLAYGVGRNLAHNTFQALLADTFSEKARPRAVTIYEVVTLLGLVMGAGGLGSALETFDPGRLISVSMVVAIVVLGLTVLASLGQEKRSEVEVKATEKARETPFGQVLREVVIADPQVRLFFILVLLTFIGTLAQDVFLEPYGALVLNMPVGATTRLTSFWGLGVMASMLLSGIVLINLFGYMRVLRAGLVVSIFVFIGVIASGAIASINLFRILVLIMGLGTGLAGAGMLTGVINFTTKIRAGMLMGVWGMANMVGHALGSIIWGGVVDTVLRLTDQNSMLAYSAVFSIEVLLLIVALILSTRFQPEAARAKIEQVETIGAVPSPAA